MLEFYFPETLYNETSIWIDLVLILLGGIISFFGAYIIASYSFKKHLKEERKKLNDENINRLKFFALLVDSASINIKKHSDDFNKIGKLIKDEPAEPHYLIKTASADIDRLYRLSSENIYKSYTWLLGFLDSNINDFKNLFYSIDFLFLEMELLFSTNEKQLNFLHKDQLYIQNIINEIDNEIVKIIKELEINNKGSNYHYLISWRDKYIELTDKRVNITTIIENFVIPFIEDLRNEKSQELYFPNLNSYCSNIIVKYEHIISNSLRLSTELINAKGGFRTFFK